MPSCSAGTFRKLAVSGGSDSSSSSIVPVASASPSVAPDGFDSSTVNVSSSSSAESSAVCTRTVCDVAFAAKVSVPDAAVKSVPLSAVPPDVA